MRLIPNFKGFDFFPHDLRLPFMRFKGLCLALSIVAMLLSLALVWQRGFNYGVDFTGGTMMEVQSKSGPADIARAARHAGAARHRRRADPELRQRPGDVLIRIEQQKGGEAEQQAAIEKVRGALGEQYEQRRYESVGPAVSSRAALDRLHGRGGGPRSPSSPTCGCASSGSSRWAPSWR